MTTTHPASGATERLELPVSGMTCSSCANRVARSLNALEDVEASVNYATERATVSYDAASTEPQQLVDAVEAAGYEATLPADTPDSADAGEVAADAEPRRRLTISAVLALPVLVLSMVPALQFDYWQWVVLALASPVVTWGAWPLHRAAWANLRHGAATMDTLVSVGVSAAYLWSLYALIFGQAGETGMTMHFELVSSGDATDHLYLEVAAGVTAFILAGRYFEARAKSRAGAALRALMDLGVQEASVLDADGSERLVPIAEVTVGDRFVVRPGEKLATDGAVRDGRSAVDESLITGESVPVEKAPGDEVIGASINAGGRLVVEATRVGADTALAQIAQLVADAQSGQAPVQRLADRISAVFVPVVMVLSVATLVGWLLIDGSATRALTAAVAVLIIACPCALGLATPTALLVGTGRGAQMGLVIKGPEILESTRTVDTIVLDKTGTVTRGEMSVAEVTATPGADEGEMLRMAGALEDASEHPIAQAIARGAREAHGSLAPVEGFRNHEGLGVEGRVAGRQVRVGGPRLMADAGLEVPEHLEATRTQASARGTTAVLVAYDDAVQGVITVADRIRPTSAEAVRALQDLGLRPILLTGDAEPTARAVAEAVGIDEVIAEVMPADKVAEVRRLQAEGRVVAMVGDGVNDAPALAQADVGVSIGTGTDVAIEASDLTLISGDLRGAADALRLSRATLRTIRQNLAWAFGYNVAAIPLAAAGLLNPLIAGAAMALSSVSVVANALRLRRFRSRFGAS
ncbi:MAG: heavy metal translocating P-type ATPase [Solirubrobacterales bacterium]